MADKIRLYLEVPTGGKFRYMCEQLLKKARDFKNPRSLPFSLTVGGIVVEKVDEEEYFCNIKREVKRILQWVEILEIFKSDARFVSLVSKSFSKNMFSVSLKRLKVHNSSSRYVSLLAKMIDHNKTLEFIWISSLGNLSATYSIVEKAINSRNISTWHVSELNMIGLNAMINHVKDDFLFTNKDFSISLSPKEDIKKVLNDSIWTTIYRHIRFITGPRLKIYFGAKESKNIFTDRFRFCKTKMEIRERSGDSWVLSVD